MLFNRTKLLSNTNPIEKKLAGNGYRLFLRTVTATLCMLSLGQTPELHAAGEWSGNIALDGRVFLDDATFSRQEEQSFSASFEPEFYLDWQSGDRRIVVNPFFRYDSEDNERSHIDMRELYWRGSFSVLDLKVGVSEVFWGVVESNHLIDVINQTDLVENLDGEDKLGQPMVNLSLVKDWGTWELYLLPYFRERTFAGENGRLRGRYVVDTDKAFYESDDEEHHIDTAVRWSHYFGDWDIGIAHFRGTGRDPLFIPLPSPGQSVVLQPYYIQIEQTSLDLQATKGDWLWKLEALYRKGDLLEDYYAVSGGFEYTMVGVFNSQSDLGLLLEYHYDERQELATSLFQDDLFVGLRWARNDIQSTEMLAGVVIDMETDAVFANIEASRRLGASWKLAIEARVFADIDSADPYYDLRNDDYVELKLAKYF